MSGSKSIASNTPTTTTAEAAPTPTKKVSNKKLAQHTQWEIFTRNIQNTNVNKEKSNLDFFFIIKESLRKEDEE